MRIKCSICLFLLVFFGCADRQENEKEKQPNIVLLLADDLGYADVGFNGSTIFETPNLDKLASESVQFTNFYVNPVCAPSRAALLTGRDYLRTGVSHVHGGKEYINPNEVLLAQALKANGYRTGMWGKWHSGSTSGYLPWDRGFDEAYTAKLYQHNSTTGLLNGNPINHDGWVDSVLVDYAIDFMTESNHAKKPFFAYIPFLAPHQPVKAPEQDIERFRQQGLSKNFSTLAAMVYQMDRQVGRIVQFLKESKLDENTIVIFLSDNGPQHLSGFLTEEEDSLRHLTGHKGHKGNIWEMGVKSPLLIKSPHITPKNMTSLATIQDIYPTVMDIIGGQYPSNQLPLDGLSFKPVLEEEDNASMTNRTIFNFASPGWAPTSTAPYSLDGIKDEYSIVNKAALSFEDQIVSVYQGNSKLLLNPQKMDIHVENPPISILYDYQNDPSENREVSDHEVMEELRSSAEDWWGGILDSDHSFRSPTFYIGNTEHTIKANAPSAFSPSLTNSVIGLRYWKKNGDYASYLINVDKAGRYEVRVNMTGYERGSQARLIIKSGIDEVICHLDRNSTDRIPLIDLKQGKQSLKITLDTLDHDGESNVIDTIHEIVCERID